jgi:fructan beta-fructosidase
LQALPVNEVKKLRDKSRDIRASIESSRGAQTVDVFELDLTVDIPEGKKFSLVFTNINKDSVRLTIDDESMTFDRSESGITTFEKGFGAKHHAPRPSGNSIHLNIFVDVSSIEIFTNDGEVVMTELLFPTAPFSIISVKHDKGVELKRALYYKIKSIWKRG